MVTIMSSADQDLLNRVLRSDLNAYTDRVFMSLMSADNYMPHWHTRAITAALEKMIDGPVKKQMVLVPPRMGKSITGSVAFPAFLFVQNPASKIMAISHSDMLATKFHNTMRNVVRAPWSRRLNPALKFAAARKGQQSLRDTDRIIETTLHGFRYSTSMGGSITGEGADWITIDDPMNASQASSEAERNRVNNTYDEAIASRLNSKDGRILLIMQRLHADDLAGHLIANGGWNVLRIPAIAEEDTEYDLGRGQFFLRKKGTLIDERRFGRAELEERRRELGSVAFEAQYQQNPLPPDGHIFKRSWIHLVDKLPEFERTVVSADIAGSAGRGDYSVILVWGIRDHVWYLTHVYRQQLDFVDLVKLMQRIDVKHEPDLIVVEQNGLGASFRARLHEIGLKHADGKIVTVDKEVRAQAITPLLERCEVKIWRHIPQLETFLNELLSFPSSKYDDQVDAFTLPLFLRHDVWRVARNSTRVKRNPGLALPPRSSVYSLPSFGSSGGSVDRYAERNDRGLW